LVITVSHLGMEKIFTDRPLGGSMTGARSLVAAIGVLTALAGVVAAAYFDKIAGIAMVLIGGFLLTLVVTRAHD